MTKPSFPIVRVDKLLVVYVLLSVFFGLWMVYSSTAFRMDESGLDSSILNLLRFDFGKQVIGVFPGVRKHTFDFGRLIQDQEMKDI